MPDVCSPTLEQPDEPAPQELEHAVAMPLPGNEVHHSTQAPLPPMLLIEAREIRARRRAGGVVWFDFRQLCGGPRSHNDYLEIANQFHTVLLSDVPHMPVRMASEARRFTWLVDVLYDRRVNLIISAATQPEGLYAEGPLAHEFPRTASRLHEMQSAEFMALERRTVDTGLT